MKQKVNEKRIAYNQYNQLLYKVIDNSTKEYYIVSFNLIK